HTAVGQLAAELGIDRLVVVGAGAQAIAQGARTAGMTADAVTTVDDIDAAHDVLVEQIAPGDVVLFKSSRDSGLRMLGDRLVEESGTPAFPVTEVTS
ncbi:MAG: UDP-N-acetylmuramoyl-tripeptide--D-alanyl-D-alanine ligase, partial [Dermacoccus nishinomiyaensis]